MRPGWPLLTYRYIAQESEDCLPPTLAPHVGINQVSRILLTSQACSERNASANSFCAPVIALYRSQILIGR